MKLIFFTKSIIIALIILMSSPCFAQVYRYDSPGYTVVTHKPYNRVEHRVRTEIIIDLNNLRITVRRPDITKHFTISEERRGADGSHIYVCYLGNEKLYINLNDMTSIAGYKLYQLWIPYEDRGEYYMIPL